MYLAIISPSALPSFLHGSSLLPLSFKRITRESAFTLVCFKSFLFLFYSFFCMFWHWFPLFIHSFYLCMQWRCLHFTKRELLTFQSPPLFFFLNYIFFKTPPIRSFYNQNVAPTWSWHALKPNLFLDDGWWSTLIMCVDLNIFGSSCCEKHHSASWTHYQQYLEFDAIIC